MITIPATRKDKEHLRLDKILDAEREIMHDCNHDNINILTRES